MGPRDEGLDSMKMKRAHLPDAWLLLLVLRPDAIGDAQSTMCLLQILRHTTAFRTRGKGLQ